RAIEGPLRIPLGRSVQPRPRPRARARLPRRNAARRRSESVALLLDVRAAFLLDEDHARRPRLRGFARRQRRGGAAEGSCGEGPRISGKRGRDLSVAGQTKLFLPPMPSTSSGFFDRRARGARFVGPSMTTRASISAFCDVGI